MIIISPFFSVPTIVLVQLFKLSGLCLKVKAHLCQFFFFFSAEIMEREKSWPDFDIFLFVRGVQQQISQSEQRC